MYVNKIIESCDRQTDMIKRILDVNAIESNELNISLVEEDIATIMSVIVNYYRTLATNKLITLLFKNNCDTPFSKVDKNYLIQVLENIISNGIKYSEKEKQVEVEIYNSNSKLIVAVTDQGPGISIEDREKMFGKFQKLSAKSTDGENYYGLGLSIAKRYVEAMGGAIYC